MCFSWVSWTCKENLRNTERTRAKTKQKQSILLKKKKEEEASGLTYPENVVMKIDN